MKLRPGSLLLFSALAGFGAGPVLSQVRPMAVPPPPASANQPKTNVPAQTNPKPAAPPDAPVPGNPDYQPDQPQAAQVSPVPPPLPPVIWDVGSAMELLAYIQQIGVEGLNPADYDPTALQAAIQSGNPAAISDAATKRFNLV